VSLRYVNIEHNKMDVTTLKWIPYLTTHNALRKYRRLLKRIQLTFTVWVQSLNTPYVGGEKIYRSCQKYDSLSLHDLLSTGHHLLGVSFTTSLKRNLCTALSKQNTTENNCIISHAQNTTALQPNVFLTGIHLLLVTSKGRSVFFQRKPLLRSTANSTVTMCTHVVNCFDFTKLYHGRFSNMDIFSPFPLHLGSTESFRTVGSTCLIVIQI
jgi:hypothetical protein